MRIIAKILVILIGLGLTGVGGWMIQVGKAHDTNQYRWEIDRSIRGAEPLIRWAHDTLQKLPKEHRDKLQINETGMLYPLGGLGGVAGVLGIIFLLNGIFRFKIDKYKYVRKDDASRVSDELLGAVRGEAPAAAGEDGKGDALSIDESLLDVEEDIAESMRDINYLVTISQGTVEPEICEHVIQMFRPDMKRYMHWFNEQSTDKLVHQILESVILRHHRQSESMTADQFQAQDARINECERQTFARRYMPAKQKITSGDMHEHVGKVFDLPDQAKVQQKFAGEADDWMDLSLRNVVDAMKTKTALETE